MASGVRKDTSVPELALAAGAVALFGWLVRKFLRGRQVSTPKTQDAPGDDRRARIAAHVAKVESDPEHERLRAEIADDRVRGISPERMIGEKELLARKRKVKDTA